MKKPTVTSWCMEDKLIPYVHYIPLNDDYSDFEIQYDWALAHDQECKQISKNANYFMEQFMDQENELFIEKTVITKFLENVIIK